MPPFTSTSAASAASRGGLSKSPAKLAALSRLHAARRGRRQSASSRERDTVLAEVLAAAREPERGVRSIRVVAAWCRVSDRTVRRWLTGEDWPPAQQVRRMRQWLRSLAP